MMADGQALGANMQALGAKRHLLAVSLTMTHDWCFNF